MMILLDASVTAHFGPDKEGCCLRANRIVALAALFMQTVDPWQTDLTQCAQHPNCMCIGA